MGFEGKVAVITGGARGIGEACAWAFLNQGADVLLADINAERATNAAQKMSEKYPQRRVRIFKVNTKYQADCLAMGEYAVQELGTVDILVNSAGITSQRPSIDVSEEDWNNLVGINMSGVFFCSQAAARAMQAGSHGGVIINLSSMNSEAGVPWRASYCAAKAGVNLLTRTLAIEWASMGIRVNAVAPGWVATELTQGAVERGVLDIEKLKRVNPLNRIAEVEDVANAILFLASDKASYITGQTLFVDGGMVIGAVATTIR